MQAPEVFEQRVLWTIFAGVQVNGVGRRRMNHELTAIYGEYSIWKVEKSGKIGWAGYVERMPEYTLQSWCSQGIRMPQEDLGGSAERFGKC